MPSLASGRVPNDSTVRRYTRLAIAVVGDSVDVTLVSSRRACLAVDATATLGGVPMAVEDRGHGATGTGSSVGEVETRCVPPTFRVQRSRVPSGADPLAWDKRFGNLSAQVLVVATEWDATSTGSCSVDWPVRAPQLIAYLGTHNIGVFGWAFDLPCTLVKDWTWARTSFVNWNCSAPGGGAGDLPEEHLHQVGVVVLLWSSPSCSGAR